MVAEVVTANKKRKRTNANKDASKKKQEVTKGETKPIEQEEEQPAKQGKI
jgi:ATP-dependent RNA helicase DDX18/HAS1